MADLIETFGSKKFFYNIVEEQELLGISAGYDFSNITKAPCKSEEFISANYQFLIDYVLTPLINFTQNSHNEEKIKDYLRALTINTLENSMEDKTKLVMGQSNEEINLLKDFWNKNEKIILAALNVQSQYGDIDIDERAELVETYEKFSKTGKHTSKYRVCFKGNAEITNIKKTDWALAVTKIALKHNLFNCDNFALWKSNRTSGFEMLKKQTEITDNEIKWSRYRKEPLTYNGEEFYASGNWGKDHWPKITSLVAEIFPDITIKEN
ncbi:MAG: hypothetical protein HN353_14310 [Bdellovibrionales bacterium]|jgi:hypothetical protein|nr:hypothetical protein [Bdellovibrionales bacterium]MBT3526985.1 hypothetical protein [Bdellovibrionales bacterium]